MKQLQLLVAIVPLLIIATLSNVYASSHRLDVPEDRYCVDIDCLKEKIKRICKDGSVPPYLDCDNILRCINAGEQQIMMKCVRGYPADNESRSCNSCSLLPNFRFRSQKS